MSMVLRPYAPSDCQALAELFHHTVHTVNAGDYTPEQLDAWSPGAVDLEGWNRSFLEHHTLVAEESGRIVGFGDMDGTGYLDRLYVHKDCQGRGIASAICEALERAADTAGLTTHASITARPFFEKRGWQVVKEQQVERRGVLLTNYIMKKTNSGPSAERSP
jgi:putative acetyltransferase